MAPSQTEATLTVGPPEPHEYLALRAAAGLSAMNAATAEIALPRSLFAVCLRSDGDLIGMGRVVGDGLHIQVVDIAVHPDHQGRGLSRQIMESIMDFLADLPDGVVISLFADIDWLYKKFGFGVPEVSVGMFLKERPLMSATQQTAAILTGLVE